MTIFRSPEQQRFHDVVAKHRGRPLLLEGAAGLGKTRAMLVCAEGFGKAVICVPTRALAQQMAGSVDATATGVTPTIYTPAREWATRAEYRDHRQHCRDSQLLVCTHMAALIDVLADGLLLGLDERNLIIFDEADQLPSAASLQRDWSLPAGMTLDEATASDEVETRAAASAITKAIESPKWYKKVGTNEDGALRLVHDLPARMLRPLFDHQRLAFVSATLSINGSFDDFKRALGLRDVAPASTIIEPKHHGKLQLVSAGLDAQAVDFHDKAARHIAKLEGPTLVIATSHADAESLGQRVAGATVRTESESVGQAAARLTGSVLIAAGAWAGLDTPIRWEHVVMLKVPYAAPTVLDGHEVTRYSDSRNAALRRFRQGLARGLRTPDAECVLHLLDARFERPEFKAAMPTRFALAYIRRTAVIEVRTAQGAFRRRMFDRWGGRCVVTGCDVPEMLDAAHADAKGGWRTNHTEGWLLRADLHRAHDAGLLQLCPETGKVLSAAPGVLPLMPPKVDVQQP
jgi:Rad3-related DNA helicase